MKNDAQQLLTDFQARNMGQVHYFNQFMNAEGKVFPLGVLRNEFRDVTSAWYLEDGKRVFLNLPLLVHIETLRATKSGGPCNVWSFENVVPKWRVALDYQGERLEENFYALDQTKALTRAKYLMSCKLKAPIQNISAWFRDHPASAQAHRI